MGEEFYRAVDLWDDWYRGKVAKFHSYKVNNSGETLNCERYSLGMAKKVCEDWANLLLTEKVKITLEGKKEQEFVDQVFNDNNFRVRASEMQEKKAAYGTAAYIVQATQQATESDGALLPDASGITIECVTAKGGIYPLTWSNGEATECAFTSDFVEGGDKYLYLQIHRRNGDGLYDIENRLYKVESDNLQEVPVGTIKKMENVPSVVHTGLAKPSFVLDRLNIANNFECVYGYNLPLGISVYANAIDCLKGVDIAFDSYINEFVLGKKRIMVKPQATTYLDGEPIFDPRELTYYVLPEDTANNSVIQPIDMALRTQEHNTGIQDMLNLLSAKCGFGENHYKFDGGSVATATQVVSENSTKFQTKKKHENILEQVLTELCRIILRVGNTAMGAGLREDVAISIDFDDSIIEDKAADRAWQMQMLNAGILNDWEARAMWLNEDEQTAKAALPKMEDMVDEGQEEIE